MCAVVSSGFVLARRPPAAMVETARPSGHDAVALSVVACSGDAQWVNEVELDRGPFEVRPVSVAATDGGDGTVRRSDAFPCPVETVPAGKLGPIGLAVEELLADERDGHPVVLLDSLAALVEEFGRERTFRFLHVVRQLAATNDASLLLHADPGLDEETVATFEPLFETVESRP